MVLQVPAQGAGAEGQDGVALAREVQGPRAVLKLARLRAGLRLPAGIAHEPEGEVRGLVIDERIKLSSHNLEVVTGKKSREIIGHSGRYCYSGENIEKSSKKRPCCIPSN